MLVRKALLKDATNIYDLVNSLSGDGTLLKRSFAEICENVRDFTVAESDGGVFLGLRRIALLWSASVRGALDRGETRGEGTKRRRTHSEVLDRRSRGARNPVGVPVHAHSGFLFQVWISSSRGQDGTARQDFQGLPALSAAAPLR